MSKFQIIGPKLELLATKPVVVEGHGGINHIKTQAAKSLGMLFEVEAKGLNGKILGQGLRKDLVALNRLRAVPLLGQASEMIHFLSLKALDRRKIS